MLVKKCLDRWGKWAIMWSHLNAKTLDTLVLKTCET